MDKKTDKFQTIVPKIFCFLLALSLWLYVTYVENPIKSYELKNIPVELTNIENIAEAGLIVSEGQKFTADLRLEGPSTEIFKVKADDFKLVADFSNYALKLGENNIPVKVIKNPQTISIKNSTQLSIKVNLEEMVSSEMNVTSQVKLAYQDNVYEVSQKTEPGRVKIYGSSNTINKIKKVVINGEQKNIESDFVNDYEIKCIDENGEEIKSAITDVSKVQLIVKTSKGKKVPVNLKISGTPKTGAELRGYEINPNSVIILGEEDNLNTIESVDTEPVNISEKSSEIETDVGIIIPEGISTLNGVDTVRAVIHINSASSSEDTSEEDKTEKSEKSLEVKVNYNGNLEGHNIINAPQHVKITLSGPAEELEKASSSDFEAVVEVDKLTYHKEVITVPKISVKNENEHITINDIEAVKIEFD